MGPDGVVVMAPLLNEDLGFLQAVEDFAVEQFVPQFAVEAFAIAVLPGAARLDVERLGADTCQPAPHYLGGHPRTVVGSDVLRDAAQQHHVSHGLQNTQAVDPPGDPDRQAFPGELIDQRHQPQLAAIMGLALDKVIGPGIVAPLRTQTDELASRSMNTFIFLGPERDLTKDEIEALMHIKAGVLVSDLACRNLEMENLIERRLGGWNLTVAGECRLAAGK
jgi:hypothetical protein